MSTLLFLAPFAFVMLRQRSIFALPAEGMWKGSVVPSLRLDDKGKLLPKCMHLPCVMSTLLVVVPFPFVMLRSRSIFTLPAEGMWKGSVVPSLRRDDSGKLLCKYVLLPCVMSKLLFISPIAFVMLRQRSIFALPAEGTWKGRVVPSLRWDDSAKLLPKCMHLPCVMSTLLFISRIAFVMEARSI